MGNRPFPTTQFPEVRRINCQDGDSFPEGIHKFNLISFPTIVNMNHGPHITGHKGVLGKLAQENGKFMLADHVLHTPFRVGIHHDLADVLGANFLGIVEVILHGKPNHEDHSVERSRSLKRKSVRDLGHLEIISRMIPHALLRLLRR